MPSIFLSHSHPDKPFAKKLANDLRRAGYIVWIDEAEIKIGDSLIEKIRDGLDRVDYVAALLSKASIDSQWVKKELDIASNREIDENRVVVLPLLLEDVELPGFLKGKLYGDFRQEDEYDKTLQRLLDAIGPSEPIEDIDKDELERLKMELQQAKETIEHHTRDQQRRSIAIASNWSPALSEAVKKANIEFPHHKQVNEAYAFEVGSMPITLDYMLWAVAKASRRGSHPLEMLLTIKDKWQEAELMLDAYSDYLSLQEKNG